MGKKDSRFESLRDIYEEETRLRRKREKLKIPCSHTNDKGKIKVDFIKGTVARCRKCGAQFDFSQIPMDDLYEAIDVVHNALNQIKALSNDPEKESKLISDLGSIDYNLSEMAELYKRTIEKNGKGGKNKKKHSDNSFGSYGANSLDFIGGRSGNGCKRKY